MPSQKDVFFDHVREMKAGIFIPIFVDLTETYSNSSFEEVITENNERADFCERITTDTIALVQRKNDAMKL